MRRGSVIVPIVVLLSLGACGEPDDGPPAAGSGTVTPAPDTWMGPGPTPTPSPDAAAATPAPTPAAAKAKPSGSGDAAWGTQYAVLTSSDPTTRQITYDLVEWFDGAEAVKACAEDGEPAAENGFCEGYYIRNVNARLRTLTVHPDAPIRLGLPGETREVDLPAFLDAVGTGGVIRFDVQADRVMALEQVYLP